MLRGMDGVDRPVGRGLQAAQAPLLFYQCGAAQD